MSAALLAIAMLGFIYIAVSVVHGYMTANPKDVREAEATFREEGCMKAIDVLYAHSDKVNNFALRRAWSVFQADHQERFRKQKREEAKRKKLDKDKEK